MKTLKKKAFVGDIIYFGVALFLLLISIVTGLMVYKTVTNGINESIGYEGLSANVVSRLNMTLLERGLFDKFAFAIIIGYFIGLLAVAIKMRVSPGFIPLYLIIWIVSIVLGAMLSNTYDEVINSSADFIAVNNTLPIAIHFMNYLPYYMALYGLVLLIVMYGSSTASGGGPL